MRLIAWMLPFGWAVGKTWISESDACAFVGARIGKMIGSECHDGYCQVMSSRPNVWRPVEGFARVSCDDAMRAASQITSNVSHDRKRPRDEDSEMDLVLADFSEEIIPAMEDLLFMKSPVSPAALVAMRRTDAALLNMFGKDSALWKENLHELLSSALFPRFAVLAQELAESTLLSFEMISPFLVRMSPMANFVIDIFSMTGERLPDRHWLVRILSTVSTFGEPGYRARYVGEVRTITTAALRVDAGRVVEFSGAISRTVGLARSRRSRDLNATLVEPLVLLMTELWNAPSLNNQLATKQMLQHQVQVELCPSLSQFTAKLVRTQPGRGGGLDAIRKLTTGLQLLLICRNVNSQLGVSARQYRSIFVNPDRPGDAIVRPPGVTATAYLSNDQRIWTELSTRSLGDEESLLDEFVAEADPLTGTGVDRRLKNRAELGSQFEATMRAFGRAVALVIRKGGSVHRLGVSPGVVRLIARHVRVNSVVHPLRKGCRENIMEPIYYFNKGAMDVLGVAGFDIIPLTALMNRFVASQYMA